MIGAIAGDIIGSYYESRPTKRTDFQLFHPQCRFTDDSVLTIAVASAILDDGSYRDALLAFGRRYPHAGYGAHFLRWLMSDDPTPYNSFGNGAAMRVSPVGFAFDALEQVLREARRSAQVSHDHPQGVRGAQATACAIFLARNGASKTEIRQEISARFGYDLDRHVDQIRPDYRFDVTCQGSVPEAIIAFLDSDSWEGAVRNAVSLGGDSDTQACIAGAIAEAFYGGIDRTVRARVYQFLDPELGEVVTRFCERYPTAAVVPAGTRR